MLAGLDTVGTLVRMSLPGPARRLATSLTLALLATTLAAVPLATTPAATSNTSGAGVQVTDGCLRSVPERGKQQAVRICFTLFRPAGASRREPVPLMVHSHGWGGSRTTEASGFGRWLDAGYGVLSFDQRGFGESGGYAHVERPQFEGRDNMRLIRMVAQLPWVQQDAPGDPRMGAMGGSYGGGYQFLAAFMAIQRRGVPVYDALAPQITWHDLSESLGPQGVPRERWAQLLGVGAQSTDALEPKFREALVEGTVTGDWPDGSGPSGVDMYRYFKKNGPSWHVAQGRRLGIPVLLGQGTTDTLFNLRQGFDNWQQALTRRARERSIFVGYNGGHVLPGAGATSLPPTPHPQGDPCSAELAGGDFTALTIRFMDEQLRGRDTGLGGFGAYHLATLGNTCTTVSSVEPTAAYDVGTVSTPETLPAWRAFPVAEGPVRVAGSPRLTAAVTTTGPLTHRAFYGLAVGTTPLDAKLVQGNVYPLDVEGEVTGLQRQVELPAVAVDVPEGQTLYLVASDASDAFGGTRARTPGVVVLDGTVAHLPVVAP